MDCSSFTSADVTSIEYISMLVAWIPALVIGFITFLCVDKLTPGMANHNAWRLHGVVSIVAGLSVFGVVITLILGSGLLKGLLCA